MFEIYWNHSHSKLLVEDENGVTHFDEMTYSFIYKADAEIERQFPETHAVLCRMFGSAKEFAKARVRQFFACNFSFKDDKKDIDEDWNFIIETVPCPARVTGLCKMPICNPVKNSELSEREIEVLRFFCLGLNEDEIADKLFIAKATVHNHINNMYSKLGFTNKTHSDRRLIAYAYNKKIV